MEDEYRLSGDRPKLIYVKGPTSERERRLSELQERIRQDDRASYKPFERAEELRELNPILGSTYAPRLEKFSHLYFQC